MGRLWPDTTDLSFLRLIQVSKFWSDFRARAPFAYSTGADDAYRGLDRYNDALHALEEEAVYFHELEELFELAPSKFPELGNARGELRQLKTVWDMVGMVTSLFDSWRRTLWADIDTEDLLEETNALLRQVQRLPKTTRGWGVYRSLEADMRNMATVLPLVSELHRCALAAFMPVSRPWVVSYPSCLPFYSSDAMCERHWKQLMQVTNKSFEKGPSFCLDDVLQLNLHEHVDAVSDIVETANKELKIDQKLRKIEGAWDGLRLEFVPYGDGEISALAAPDEVLDTLDDHQLQLQTMAGMGRCAACPSHCPNQPTNTHTHSLSPTAMRCATACQVCGLLSRPRRVVDGHAVHGGDGAQAVALRAAAVGVAGGHLPHQHRHPIPASRGHQEVRDPGSGV